MPDTWSGLYGRGWKFPPEFDEQGPVMVCDEDDIAQSLEILFRTELGERIMRADYGCGLISTVFENINADLLAELRTRIGESVLRDEPRVKLDNLVVEQVPESPNRLYIQVNYRLLGIDRIEALNIEFDLGSGLNSVRRLGGRYA